MNTQTFLTRIALSVSLILLTGCASTNSSGPAFRLHDRVSAIESIIYFYQVEKLDLASGCLMVSIDNQDAGCIGNPGYMKTSVTPGNHSFTFRRKAIIDIKSIKVFPFSFNFEAGKAYYIKHKVIPYNGDTSGAVAIDCCYGENEQGLFLVPKPVAVTEMAVLRLW